MGCRWAQWVGDDLLFRLGVTPVCKCCIRTPWENERLPTAASKRNRNVKTLWCCNVRIWNVGSDRLMVLISFGWIREQCHLAYIMTEEWSKLPTTLRCQAAAVRVNAASYRHSVLEDGESKMGSWLGTKFLGSLAHQSMHVLCASAHLFPYVCGLFSQQGIANLIDKIASVHFGTRASHCRLPEHSDESSTCAGLCMCVSASHKIFFFVVFSPSLAPVKGGDIWRGELICACMF